MYSHVVLFSFAPFSPIFFSKVNKAKSQGEKTPQKAGAAKKKNSSAKKETDSKKKKSTPGKGGSLKAFKKENAEVRKVLDFMQQAAETKHTSNAEETFVSEISTGGTEGLLWVDKYKPTSVKTIIGQQGEQSCANKLLRWLRNWHENTSENKHGDYAFSTSVCWQVFSVGVWHLHSSTSYTANRDIFPQRKQL